MARILKLSITVIKRDLVCFAEIPVPMIDLSSGVKVLLTKSTVSPIFEVLYTQYISWSALKDLSNSWFDSTTFLSLRLSAFIFACVGVMVEKDIVEIMLEEDWFSSCSLRWYGRSLRCTSLLCWMHIYLKRGGCQKWKASILEFSFSPGGDLVLVKIIWEV